MYPFLTVDAVGEYDVDCGVIGGGTSGQWFLLPTVSSEKRSCFAVLNESTI